MKSTGQKSYLSREATEVGCAGLVGGTALNLYTHREHAAGSSFKMDGPFYCAICKSDAILHKCTEKIDHFSHIARLSPVLGPLESALHQNCKNEICTALAERHPDGKWAVERQIRANLEHNIPELRPDISGRISQHRVAIEVQASALTPTKIINRSQAYARRGIALLWLVPLHEPLGLEPIRPRLFERYIHSIYYGRIYYWWPGRRHSLLPVHFGPASRHVEFRVWLEDGEEQERGGYDAEYKIIKTPLRGPELLIDDDFEVRLRTEFSPENERKTVPECRIWMDKVREWW